MSLLSNKDDLKQLVESLNFKEKVERSKQLLKEAYAKYGDSLVVANSLGKDSVAVWDLAKKGTFKRPLRLLINNILYEELSVQAPILNCFR